MGHKTLVNGTAYEIDGGRTLIGGTGYEIKSGRTLVDGTGYGIDFMEALPKLFHEMTVHAVRGHNQPDTKFMNFDVTDYNVPIGTRAYMLVFCSGDLGIHKVVVGSPPSKEYWLHPDDDTLYHGRSSSYGSAGLCTSGGIVFNNYLYGYDATGTRGSTMALVTFDASEEEADALLRTLQKVVSASKSSSTAGKVSLEQSTVAEDDILFVGLGELFSINRIIDTVSGAVETLAGNCADNPSLLYVNGGNWYISDTGTDAKSVNGATLHVARGELTL